MQLFLAIRKSQRSSLIFCCSLKNVVRFDLQPPNFIILYIPPESEFSQISGKKRASFRLFNLTTWQDCANARLSRVFWHFHKPNKEAGNKGPHECSFTIPLFILHFLTTYGACTYDVRNIFGFSDTRTPPLSAFSNCLTL